MIVTPFPQANCQFTPPKGYSEQQVGTVPAFNGVIKGGSMDGSTVIVTAWKPDPIDIERLQQGGLIYLTCVSVLPAHMLTTDFSSATNPA